MVDLTGVSELMAGAAPPHRERQPGERLRVDGARGQMDYTPPVRTKAIRRAGRHTARVKFLKRLIIAGVVLGGSTIAIAVAFDPFRHLPGSISLAGVGVSGTKITMESPKISGVQQGGGPYEIKAKAGIQDITKPSVMELVGVDAKVGMADLTTTHIRSDHGLYDGKADRMELGGNVRIANTSGYVLNMRSAAMDFRAGVFSSHERLSVDLRGGTVAADDMAISNSGHVIAFRGHIVSSFRPADDDSAAGGDSPLPKGTQAAAAR